MVHETSKLHWCTHILVIEFVCQKLSSSLGAFHAKPVPTRNTVEAYAIGMIGRIAVITEQKDIFFVGTTAYGTWSRVLFLFWILVEPGLGIEFGDLFLVLDVIGRQAGP